MHQLADPSAQGERVQNKDDLYREFYDGMQMKYLRSIVCSEVIEEHRRKPLGQHSEPLERLLLFFRRLPNAGKLVVKKDEAAGCFRIAALSGVRGRAPTLVEDREYATLDDAYHGIFLRQIDELMGAESG